MKFSVQSYMKGTSNRGFILGAVDDVLQILDDSAMNLQSMSASRFVGPFMNSVQNWEKSLSLISEVLDVSIETTDDNFYAPRLKLGGILRLKYPSVRTSTQYI